MACVFRSVLTRAELEALPLDNHLKEDVAKGKVRILLYIGFYFTATRTAYILFRVADLHIYSALPVWSVMYTLYSTGTRTYNYFN